jgi:NitT/TauT family transport system permease protein
VPTETLAPPRRLVLRLFSRAPLRRRTWSRLADVAVFAAVLGVFYGVLALGRTWLGPFAPVAHISSSPRALPLYAAASLARIGIAYFFSLAFAIAYGYLAARSRRAERVLLPLLDILQSIPVLSFLPGVMLAMVALFPRRQMGVELGAILLIFTGQAWNIAFSFYSSLKAIPRELDEAARIYRFSRWQRFIELEVPYAAIGLVWNSMMSVAGGWFFLMACEMFVLGDRDFRLPGLGSYLQVAAGAGDTRAILWGLGAMIGVIVLLDQLVWRPVIAWAEKFKFEEVEAAEVGRPFVLGLLRRSGLVALFYRKVVQPLGERMTRASAKPAGAAASEGKPRFSESGAGRVLLATIAAVAVVALGYGFVRASLLLATLRGGDALELLRGATFTFLRVNAALVLGALWAVPAGVAIGSNPRLARIAQPLAQIAASVPATALFPVVLLVLIRAGGGMGAASLLLMLLGTQWYILFNVIAGTMAIPTDLKEAAGVFRFGRWDRWRRLILPAIFPYLVTGMLTAAGGAWNASIVAEYFHFRGRILSATGLGATISRATDAGQFALLLAATLVMAVIVVAVNRLLWQRLYRLAESRFKLGG